MFLQYSSHFLIRRSCDNSTTLAVSGIVIIPIFLEPFRGIFMNNQKLITSLHTGLASIYGLYIKTQNYHWNVTGPNFASLHILFEQQYIMLRDDVDSIAEHIRIQGHKVPASFEVFERENICKNGDHNANATSMLTDLVNDYDTVLAHFREILNTAQELHDEGTNNMISDFITRYEKNRWMLTASM